MRFHRRARWDAHSELYLQEYKDGRTQQQLALHFSIFPWSAILVSLEELRKDDCVTFADGVWALKRDAPK